MNHKDDEKAAEKEAFLYRAGLRIKTDSIHQREASGDRMARGFRDGFLAGCTHVRASAEWKAMELVVRKAIGVSGAYEADIYTPAAMSDLDNALSELDRIREDK